MACAAYVINRVPLSPINMKSPYELMFEEKPSVKYLRFLALFVMFMCRMQKELNWMPRLINSSLLDMTKEKKGGSAWIS